MSGFYKDQWQVPSSSNPSKSYTVSLTMADEWQCSCPGWTTHMPRRDCKHIKQMRRDLQIAGAPVLTRDRD